MLKIIITGPESCGKTTLAQQLAAHFQIPLVEEYARTFFEKKQTPQYNEADLLKIAVEQLAAENQAKITLFEQLRSKKASNLPRLIICDTDLLTIKIWSEEKYERCDTWIIEQIPKRSFKILEVMTRQEAIRLHSINPANFDGQISSVSLQIPMVKLHTIYLLCSPEGIAWEADPLRENAHDRERLFDIYEKNLIFYKKNYKILRGGIDARFDEVGRYVEKVERLLRRQDKAIENL